MFRYDGDMIASIDRLFTQPAQHDPLGMQRRAGVSASNGTDLGQVLALLSDVLIGLHTFQEQVATNLRRLTGQFASVRAEIGILRQDTANQFASVRAEVSTLRAEVSTLREEVAAYHGSVVGHGILITELDTRLHRVEQHLDLPPAA